MQYRQCKWMGRFVMAVAVGRWLWGQGARPSELQLWPYRRIVGPGLACPVRRIRKSHSTSMIAFCTANEY